MRAVRAVAAVALCGLLGAVGAGAVAHADSSALAKELLLKQFDLSKPSQRQAREVDQIPKFMLEEYERKTGQKADTSHFRKPGTRTGLANTQLAYPCKSVLNTTEPTQMRSIFECDFKDFEKSGYTMESAFLRVHWTPKLSVKRSSGSFRATVSDLTKARDWISTPQDVKKIFHRNAELDEGSYEFDVTDAVLRWSTQKTKRARLLLEKTKMKVKSMPSVSVIPQGVFDSAYLVVYAESRDQRQRRLERRSAHAQKPSHSGHSGRSASDKAARAHQSQANPKRRRQKLRQQRPCQRHPMYVDFERVGWNDWIVAPPGYQAYHCDGECRFPLADHHNATNHATVQVLVNSVNPGAVPTACCVPTTLSPISLLYLEEEGRVVLKSYENMIAENCGCR